MAVVVDATYVCEQEERDQVYERIRELPVLFERDPNLLPSDSDIMFTLR